MCDGVRETSCTRCEHREVCVYKDKYLQYLKGFEDFHNGYLDDQRESFIKQYSYRPIARKHLPYQRRNY